jgi:DNA-binding MarR family transcriptional regulator
MRTDGVIGSWQRQAALQRERWREARSFQSFVQKTLSRFRISFAEWLILAAIAELALSSGENVSQNAIARQTGLSRMVVAYWLKILERKALVGRGEHDDPRAWGVVLAPDGLHTLEGCDERLEAAALTR